MKKIFIRSLITTFSQIKHPLRIQKKKHKMHCLKCVLDDADTSPLSKGKIA